MSLILLVLFVMVLFLWLLALLGAVPGAPAYHPWLGWFAVLLLGLAVFVFGFGPAAWRLP